jgi:hypothetical protein
MVYRLYVNATDASDKMSAVFGNDQAHLIIETPDGIFNSPFNSGWNAAGINPLFLPSFPSLADDSYATIGLSGPATTTVGEADPSLVEDNTLTPTISGYFIGGGAGLNVNTLTGGSWYVLNTAANALPVDGRWLIAQITTTGSISGQMNYQVFPLGVGADQVQTSVTFDGVGTFGATIDVVCGCMDETACNYDASATNDDGSCTYQTDPLLNCDGTCINDADGDGVCDENEVAGCTNAAACNYDASATDDDGSCAQLDECAFVEVLELLTVLATVTETSLTHVAYAVGLALMQMLMASVTTWTTASVRSTLAASATVLARCTTAVAPTSLLVTVTATATNLTPSAFVAVRARRMRMRTAFATTSMTALALSTVAACATVMERPAQVVPILLRATTTKTTSSRTTVSAFTPRPSTWT